MADKQRQTREALRSHTLSVSEAIERSAQSSRFDKRAHMATLRAYGVADFYYRQSLRAASRESAK